MKSIEEKIQKIINLMEGAKSEGELNAATQMLQKLLAKYHLSMADVEVKENKEQFVYHRELTTTEDWCRFLLDAIADNMRCRTFRRCYKYHKGRSYSYSTNSVIVGCTDDLEIALETYYTAEKVARKLYRQWSKEWRQNHYNCQTPAICRKSWYEGFVAGLRKALEEQKNSNEELSIVLQTPAMVKDYMSNLNLQMNNHSRTRSIEPDSWTAGKSSGFGFGSRNRMTCVA